MKVGKQASVLFTFHWPKYMAWSHLTLKEAEEGSPAMCSKKGNRKYVLNSEMSQAQVYSSQDFRACHHIIKSSAHGTETW